jgi:hypothetical protein
MASMPFAREPLLTHSGSNAMNLAMIILQSAREFGIVLATNVGGKSADQALRALPRICSDASGGAPDKAIARRRPPAQARASYTDNLGDRTAGR